MHLTGKLVLSALIALIATITTSFIQQDRLIDPLLLIAFLAATLLTALAIHGAPRLADRRGADSGAAPTRKRGGGSRATAPVGESREQGTVKWFNRNKGFGFIIRDNGEEIFVHFRAIRGEGRRSLQDGQRVAFHTASSRKGPQAEDVEVLERAG